MELLIMLGLGVIFAAAVEMSPLRSGAVDDDDDMDDDEYRAIGPGEALDRFNGKTEEWGYFPDPTGDCMINLGGLPDDDDLL